MKIIKHQAIVRNWIRPNEIESPKTLVLGSFNPYNKNDKSDIGYYYGRPSNRFWESLAGISKPNKPKNYFFEKGGLANKKKFMNENNFCCLDVINEIKFSCKNQKALEDYVNKKVFLSFSDQAIWVGKTKYKGHDIELIREYNNSIIEFLQQSKSIKKVIHTMGTTRIPKLTKANPKELGIGVEGFGDFVDRIKEVCKEKRIKFIYESISPSKRNWSVKSAKLDSWLMGNVIK